jgi:hypothetical protein
MIHGDGGEKDNEGEKPIPGHLIVDQKANTRSGMVKYVADGARERREARVALMLHETVARKTRKSQSRTQSIDYVDITTSRDVPKEAYLVSISSFPVTVQ